MGAGDGHGNGDGNGWPHREVLSLRWHQSNLQVQWVEVVVRLQPAQVL